MDFGIANGDDIDLSLLCFFFEKGSLSHAYTNVHLGTAYVVESWTHLATLLADKNIKVNIDVAAKGLVKLFLV